MWRRDMWRRDMWRRELQAVAACWRLGWDQAREQRMRLLGQSVLYVIVLAIFWALWIATPMHELRGWTPTRESLLWYLAITEWIAFAPGAPYREVEAEITSGAIESALLRPLPHGLATLARWSGSTAYCMTVMAVVAVATAWLLTGHPPPHPRAAPLVVLSATLSLLLILLCQLQIGYVAVWFGVSGPVFWVWQKLVFVLGGLQFPLLLYPDLLRRVAESSPFAAMLFAPGSLVLDGGAGFVSLIASQLLWLAILGAMTLAVSRAVTARLVRTGG